MVFMTMLVFKSVSRLKNYNNNEMDFISVLDLLLDLGKRNLLSVLDDIPWTCESLTKFSRWLLLKLTPNLKCLSSR